MAKVCRKAGLGPSRSLPRSPSLEASSLSVRRLDSQDRAALEPIRAILDPPKKRTDIGMKTAVIGTGLIRIHHVIRWRKSAGRREAWKRGGWHARDNFDRSGRSVGAWAFCVPRQRLDSRPSGHRRDRSDHPTIAGPESPLAEGTPDRADRRVGPQGGSEDGLQPRVRTIPILSWLRFAGEKEGGAKKRRKEE